MGKVNKESRFVMDSNGQGCLRLGKDIPAQRLSKPFLQVDNSRILEYTSTGRLAGITFLDLSNVDLSNLPQDDIIPADPVLLEIFNVHNLTPKFKADRE